MCNDVSAQAYYSMLAQLGYFSKYTENLCHVPFVLWEVFMKKGDRWKRYVGVSVSVV